MKYLLHKSATHYNSMCCGVVSGKGHQVFMGRSSMSALKDAWLRADKMPSTWYW